MPSWAYLLYGGAALAAAGLCGLLASVFLFSRKIKALLSSDADRRAAE